MSASAILVNCERLPQFVHFAFNLLYLDLASHGVENSTYWLFDSNCHKLGTWCEHDLLCINSWFHSQVRGRYSYGTLFHRWHAISSPGQSYETPWLLAAVAVYIHEYHRVTCLKFPIRALKPHHRLFDTSSPRHLHVATINLDDDPALGPLKKCRLSRVTIHWILSVLNCGTLRSVMTDKKSSDVT